MALRYYVQLTDCGWDVIDSQRDVSVGVCANQTEALKTVQRLSALLDANALRVGGAEYKDYLASLGPVAACREFARVLELPEVPRAVASQPVFAVLKAIPKVGRTKANGLLASLMVKPGARRVRELSPRQREVLAGHLRDRAERLEFE